MFLSSLLTYLLLGAGVLELVERKSRYGISRKHANIIVITWPLYGTFALLAVIWYKAFIKTKDDF